MMKETIQTLTGGTALVTRHYPGCINAFLRWQVGVYETRPIRIPVYDPVIDPATGQIATNHDGTDRYALTGHQERPDILCQVFHLLGFADNLKTAKSRALAALATPSARALASL
jgi:hypothetical protein